MQKWLTVFALVLCCTLHAADNSIAAKLSEAITTQDAARQAELIRTFVDVNEPYVKQVLEAWRGGLVQLYDQNGTNIPVLLEAETDSEGRQAAKRIDDGSLLKDTTGAPLMFGPIDLTPAEGCSE